MDNMKEYADFVATINDDRVWAAVKMRVMETINPNDFSFANEKEIGSLIANAVNGSVAATLVVLEAYHKWVSE